MEEKCCPGLLHGRRVLVTGGAGFIGSNLCEHLLQNGNVVSCLDNFSTGKRENLETCLKHPAFTLVEGDIRDHAICRQACHGQEFVLHQAALGSVPRSIADPMTSTDVNVTGFVSMLFAAKEAGIRRFVYASSSSVYGDSAELPKVEERIGRQLSPYAITKYANELYAANFSQLFGIETVGLRYFNVFGRRQDPHGAYAAVIPKFALALMAGQSPTINGDGTYSRDFTYIANVIQANERAALATAPEAVNTVYNVACGSRADMNEVFYSLRQEFSRFDPAIAGIEPVYGPVRAGDVPHSLAAIDKAARLLGYAPQFDFAAGLHQTAEWYFRYLR